MTETVDRLLLHCRELVTMNGGGPLRARRGAAMQQLGVIADGAVAIRDGRIHAVGTTAEIAAIYDAPERIEMRDAVVAPAFVDCHTHPVFAATREHEFHLRCAGADYLEIAKQGGGILSSVRAVREATEDQLFERTMSIFDGFLRNGTTAVEGKSGYGLDLDSELRSLRALTRARDAHAMTVHRTFLGAHEVPLEYRSDKDRYVDVVIDEMLPAVEGLCESCDVFAEPKVFDAAMTRRVLQAAKDRGLRIRIHADEIEPMGGAQIAVEFRADSADHLPVISDEGIAAMAGSDTTAVLLPGTSFYLGKTKHAPARRLIDEGAVVALATDYNPGSCHTQSIPLICTLACVLLKMTAAECWTAVTINPAASLGFDRDLGTLHPGKRANLVALDLPSHEGLGYVFGGDPVLSTWVDGREVYRRGEVRSAPVGD